jgi:hypothetical protein
MHSSKHTALANSGSSTAAELGTCSSEKALFTCKVRSIRRRHEACTSASSADSASLFRFGASVTNRNHSFVLRSGSRERRARGPLRPERLDLAALYERPQQRLSPSRGPASIQKFSLIRPSAVTGDREEARRHEDRTTVGDLVRPLNLGRFLLAITLLQELWKRV